MRFENNNMNTFLLLSCFYITAIIEGTILDIGVGSSHNKIGDTVDLSTADQVNGDEWTVEILNLRIIEQVTKFYQFSDGKLIDCEFHSSDQSSTMLTTPNVTSNSTLTSIQSFPSSNLQSSNTLKFVSTNLPKVSSATNNSLNFFSSDLTKPSYFTTVLGSTNYGTTNHRDEWSSFTSTMNSSQNFRHSTLTFITETWPTALNPSNFTTNFKLSTKQPTISTTDNLTKPSYFTTMLESTNYGTTSHRDEWSSFTSIMNNSQNFRHSTPTFTIMQYTTLNQSNFTTNLKLSTKEPTISNTILTYASSTVDNITTISSTISSKLFTSSTLATSIKTMSPKLSSTLIQSTYPIRNETILSSRSPTSTVSILTNAITGATSSVVSPTSTVSILTNATTGSTSSVVSPTSTVSILTSRTTGFRLSHTLIPILHNERIHTTIVFKLSTLFILVSNPQNFWNDIKFIDFSFNGTEFIYSRMGGSITASYTIFYNASTAPSIENDEIMDPFCGNESMILPNVQYSRYDGSNIVNCSSIEDGCVCHDESLLYGMVSND
ncbi:hypothetical protein SNEBB_000470, partial [Seison nebaliae]